MVEIFHELAIHGIAVPHHEVFARTTQAQQNDSGGNLLRNAASRFLRQLGEECRTFAPVFTARGDVALVVATEAAPLGPRRSSLRVQPGIAESDSWIGLIDRLAGG